MFLALRKSIIKIKREEEFEPYKNGLVSSQSEGKVLAKCAFIKWAKMEALGNQL